MGRTNLLPLTCDVLVVGAGPAGLAALAALSETGVSVLTIEAGQDLDQRSEAVAADRAKGVGGAGLFSDGKFSFFPSASRLWRLRPEEDLKRAYSAVGKMLARRGLDPPKTRSTVQGNAEGRSGRFQPKRYATSYLSLDARYDLTRELAARLAGRTILGTARHIARNSSGGLNVVADTVAGPITIRAACAVYAAGRFGPLACELDVGLVDTAFRRVEIGIRIEQPAHTFFLRSDPAIDSKFICSQGYGGVAWRTFCCCRDGQLVVTDFDGWQTLSGRADCPPTGRSNIGFNVRIVTQDLGEQVWRDITARLRDRQKLVAAPLEVALNGSGARDEFILADIYGDLAGDALRAGVRKLVDDFGRDRMRDATIHAPCIEGVGSYVRLRDDLQAASGAPIWFAGDTTGIFRGLTAALVSGYFAGLRVLTHFDPSRRPIGSR